nr:hypothetical protein GCM10020063_076270 [Dactylosporangium thailandense]
MGNLGRYQDIVTTAKQLGGVEKLIETIESKAVTRAAPKLLLLGAAGGAALAASVVAGKRLWSKYKAGEVAANEAKERLRAELAKHVTSDHGDADHGEGPTDVDQSWQP